tara:strand:- start:1745 stop:2158 length:414 start_codon:yes stop_codon:yes gene_type:complete
MRFQVPQFIEHEAKVIGPFTFRQFIYLGVPGAIAFFLYFLAPFLLFIVVSMFLGAFGFLFAFIKVGGRSIPSILLNFLHFTVTPKRYIWQKKQVPVETPQALYGEAEASPQGPQKAKVQLVQKSKVKDLATRVETKR